MGLIEFALLCIHSIAWPVLALGYPLCASIRAIETGSKNHLRKLVIYWTLFTLISQFEHAFVNIIHWIPYWLSVKLIMTLLLVMPRFNGACYAYQCLIHPIFFSINLNLQPFIDTAFSQPKEEKPLMMETLGKPITLEKEPDAAQKDGEILGAIEKSAKGVKDMAPQEAIGENELPSETAPLKILKKDWICTLCNVTTTSEITLNAHLQGNKHRSKFQALTTYRESQQKTCGQPKLKQDWICTLCNVTTTSEITLNAHLQGQKHRSNIQALTTHRESQQKTCGQPKLKQYCVAHQPLKLLCRVCNVKLSSEIDMANHVKGRRHLSNIEK